MRPRSLALRAVLALLAVHVATLVVGLGSGVLEGRTTRQGGADLGMELAAKALRRTGDRWTMPPDGAFASLAARNPTLWLIAADRDRSLVVGKPPPAALRLLAGGGPAVAPDGGVASLLSDAVIEQRQIDGRRVLLAVGGVDPATVTSLDVLKTLSLAPAAALVLGLGLLGAVALLLAMPLFSRALRPIVDEATSIGPDDIGRRLDEGRAPIELLPLARAFNGALDRLEVELGRRKRLVSNVAHELRTPLAVLSLRVDAVAGPAEAREGLRAAVDRVSRLVEQMLDLERLSLPAQPQGAVDLAEVAREVTAVLAPVAVGAGHELSLDAPDGAVTVRGQRPALERAVTNLIGNAIVHGAGPIRVAVGDGWLEVSDAGPGVPEALQPRLFDAFARGGGEGSGLGLHLTREIMRAQGGEVLWRRAGTRTIFRLEFPKSPAPACP